MIEVQNSISYFSYENNKVIGEMFEGGVSYFVAARGFTVLKFGNDIMNGEGLNINWGVSRRSG